MQKRIFYYNLSDYFIKFIMKNQSKILSLSNAFLLSLGSMIGVGFLSGAEIWSFFARFGSYFFISIFVLFWLLILVLNSIFKMNDKNLKMQNLCQNKKKNTFLTKYNIKEFLANLNIFIIGSAMVAGLRNVIFELFCNYQIIIFCFLVLIVFMLLKNGYTALSKFNFLMILSVVMIIFYLILFGGFDVKFAADELGKINTSGQGGLFVSMMFAAIYVFFNTSQIVPIISNLNEKLSKKERLIFCLSFSGVFCLMVSFLVLFMAQHSDLSSSSMPLLSFFAERGIVVKYFFISSIIMALLSTLLVCLNGIKDRLNKGIKYNTLSSFLAIILVLIFGILPFKFFINVLYPLVGIISFVCFVIL